jgi:nucleotide-binding universal stress UspA family protein
MLPIEHILFPYDFSERSARTAPLVRSLAQRLGASVTLLHVIAPGTLEEPAHCAELNRVATEGLPGVRVTATSRPGDPAAIISDFARTENVGLIMMPTHGYGQLRGLLLGSVTAQVLADASCPVWTTAHVRSYNPADDEGMLRILCAVDREPCSAALMQWAAGFARNCNAGLHLVHAALSITDCPSFESEQTLQESVRSSCRAAVDQIRRSAGVEAPLSVAVGDVEEVVHDEVLRQHASMVVIGRGVLKGTLGRLRTQAHSIIRRSPCPVVCV